MINVIENKDYRNLQNDYYDGESFVFFDIIQVDAENDTITVMVSHQGKLTRTASHEKDYRGGGNCYTSLPLLNFAIKTLFERGHYCENAFYSIGL